MKKIFYLVLALLVMLPCGVLGDVKQSVKVSDKAVSESTDESTGLLNKSYSVTIVNSDYTEEDDISITTAEISFWPKEKETVKGLKCTAADGYDVTQTDSEDGKIVCKYTSKTEEGTSAESVVLGNIVVSIEKDTKGDCTILYAFNGSEGKINPNTGVNLPYAVIGAGIVVATGIYVVTKKRTKLFQI